MKIDIYKSQKNGDKYLSVPTNTDVEKIVFPDNMDQDLLSLSPLKTNLEVDTEESRLALDTRDVLNQIEKNGYAIHGATIEFN